MSATPQVKPQAQQHAKGARLDESCADTAQRQPKYHGWNAHAKPGHALPGVGAIKSQGDQARGVCEK